MEGLYLSVGASGAKSWVFMYERGGRQREAGLGSINAVTLVKARGIAASFREMLFDGRDPIDVRRAERRKQEGRKTFAQVADEFLAVKETGLRNAKHRGHWRMTLERYAAPLRDIPIADVDTTAVLSVLQPIWQTKPETASRLRGRIEAVIDVARVSGYIDRNEANPARWKGHLAKLLPKPKQLSQGHHIALPYSGLPDFMARLREHPTMASRSPSNFLF
jgi:hypothetical protein